MREKAKIAQVFPCPLPHFFLPLPSFPSPHTLATDNHELGMDCLWRLQEWPALKDTLQNKAQVGRGVEIV